MTRLKKQLAAVFLGLAVTATCIMPVGACYFSDIPSTAPYLDAVNYVSDNGLMVGSGNGRFDPNAVTTRAMLVKVLYVKAGSPATTGSTSFSDVPSGEWYTAPISWATANGIVLGIGGGLFAPDQAVTREDAMVILARFAKYMGYSTVKTCVLSGFSDYNQISSYALRSMHWAYATELIYGTSTTTLSPQDPVTRAQLASFITRYGTNIEKIVFQKDTLGFANSPSAFTTTSSFITDYHRNLLISKAAAANASATTISNIQNSLLDEWGGSCYGMSVVTVLDKLGKIGFNENFAVNASTMYDVKASKGGIVESAVNYYHATQYFDLAYMQGQTAATIEADVTLAANTVQNNNGLTLLSYFWTTTNADGDIERHGHAVVANSVVKSGNNYVFTVYNPNELKSASSTITITPSGVLTTSMSSTPLSLYNIRVLTDFSIFDQFDIDGYGNTGGTTATSSTEPYTTTSTASTSTKLSVKLVGEWEIANAAGETLCWDGYHLSGDMEVYSQGTTIEGETTPSKIILEVPSSDAFSFVSHSDSAEVYFSVVDVSWYACARGQNIDSIFADNSGTVELTGNNMNYSIGHKGSSPSVLLYTVSGSGDSHITFHEDVEGQLKIAGISGEYSVNLYDSNGAIYQKSFTSESTVANTSITIEELTAVEF